MTTGSKHIQLCSVGSTQKFLAALPGIQKEFYLVSALEQTNGVGRRSNKWLQFASGLTFSFNLPARSSVPLSLLMANALASYFKQIHGQKLLVKWPNDLFNTSGKKCGGILIQREHKMDLIGIGININHSGSNDFGHIALKDSIKNQHLLCKQIHEHIVDYSQSFDKEYWKSVCLHLNKKVEIVTEKESFTGINVDIDDKGGLVLEIDGKKQTFYSGSLRLL